MVMMLLQQVSCISQTILENNVFSCGTFAISFSVFSSTLLAPQWITICLTAGGNSSFSAHHTKFLTLSLSLHIPQFNVSFPENEFHAFVYLESPWINESPSNTVCIFLFVFNADICCWCNLCHPGLQNRPTGVDVCDRKKLHFDSSRS